MKDMGCFFAFDYFIGIIVLLCLHASWWVWLIFIAGGLFWFIIWAISNSGGSGGSSDEPKQETTKDSDAN